MVKPVTLLSCPLSPKPTEKEMGFVWAGEDAVIMGVDPKSPKPFP